MKCLKLILFSLIVISVLTSCNNKTDNKTWQPAKEISIGVAIPVKNLGQDGQDFISGIKIAMEEYNGKKLIGKKVKIKIEDDQGTVTGGIEKANEFSAAKKYTAVIGHWGSTVTIPCAEIYDKQEVIMIAPNSSSTKLIKDKYRYIFQNTMDDKYMGEKMADYAKERNLNNIAIFYANNSYGKSLANAFEDSCTKKGIEIINRSSDIGSKLQFKLTLDKLKALSCDGIFIADSLNSTSTAKKYLINIFNELKNSISIIGADGLDYEEDLEKLNQKYPKILNNLAFGTYYNLDIKDNKLLEFKERYNKLIKVKNNATNHINAKTISGYESMKLICEAIKKANSAAPHKVIEVLSNKNNQWVNLTNKLSFSSNGKLKEKSLYIKQFVNGKWQYKKVN